MTDPTPPRAAFPRYPRFELQVLPTPFDGQTHYQQRVPGDDGLTLREWFATAAMLGLLAHGGTLENGTTLAGLCGTCYMMADEMLSASGRPA